ncbi:hypothetical protein B4N89_46775 [Embleya scabrispora]|uniref:Orc1-like AAA ATPase domain-containing protein n=1 Tax=Embleya scabrispora TaxID=159449 RepID=A0A1T3NIA3_9ACTN|nr:hypothetical protein B4N89_46775 [Embleya scabrispora]
MTGPGRRFGRWFRRDTPPTPGPGSGEVAAGRGAPAAAGVRPGQWVAGSVVYGPVNQVSGITGDVHITTHTSVEWPVYRVETFPAERPAPPTAARARAQPARLLQARYALVGFTGRRNELERLAVWRDGPAGVSVLLSHGPGGQGKTRLATRFAADTRARGGDWGGCCRRATRAIPPPRAPRRVMPVSTATRGRRECCWWSTTRSDGRPST